MRTVVFDLGGVVLLWDPVPAVAAAVGQERAERFVHGSAFDFMAWNHALDAGRSWAQAEAEATASHPELGDEISGYRPNFALSLRGLVPGTAELLARLCARGVRVVALTNWSAETFPYAQQIYPGVLALFDDIVVSGSEGVAKPDPRVFELLGLRLGHPLAGVFFVDDSAGNVRAASAAGMDAVVFTDAVALEAELRQRGLLD